MNDTTKTSRKTRTGSVVSNKMEKSVVVKVERKVRHKLYGKFVKTCVKLSNTWRMIPTTGATSGISF